MNAATFEHREMVEPSVIFPVLQKITIKVHMSAHRQVCETVHTLWTERRGMCVKHVT